MAIRFDTLEELEEFTIRYAELLKASRPMTNAERCKKYRDSKKTVSNNVENVSHDTEPTREERVEERVSSLDSPSSPSSPDPIIPITPFNPSLPKEDEKEGNQISLSAAPKNRHGLKQFGVAENVWLTAEEHRKLQEKIGDRALDDLIDRFSCYIGQSKKNAQKYTNHYLALLNWHRRDQEKEEQARPTAKVSNIPRKMTAVEIARMLDEQDKQKGQVIDL